MANALLTQVSFLIANASLWNILALVTADIALLLRARLEERTLQTDETYQRYSETVPWRLVPGVY